MIRMRLLGPVDLRHADGREVGSVLEHPKRTAVLAYLAAGPAGRFVRRDALLMLFWPDLDGPHARNALSKVIHHLRRSLGADVILSRGDADVGLDPALFWCDAAAFDAALEAGRLEDALALLGGGPLLAGLHLESAPEFEQWLDAERERLRRRAAAAATRLAEATRQTGDVPGAVRWARQANEIAPFDEAALRTLLERLADAGDRAGAVAAYQAFAERLAAELDLEPSEETAALIDRIRRNPAAPDAAATGPAAPREARREPLAPHVVAPTPVTGARRAALAPVAVAVFLLLVLAAATVAKVSGRYQPAADSLAVAMEFVPDRVLVAPFENRTGDPTLDAVGSLVADWAARAISATEAIEVVDFTTALLSIRNVDADGITEPAVRLRAIAAQVRAPIVVWGSYYLRGDSLEYQGQISDVAAGRLLVALAPIRSPANDPTTAIEVLHDRIKGALATLVDDRIGTLMAPSTSPPTYEAYRLYVDGLDRFSRLQYREALPYFERAAALDSTFALPLIWMWFSYRNSERVEESRAVAQRLGAHRGRLSPLDRHAVDFILANRRGDGQAELEAVRRAAALAPQSNWTYMLAYLARTSNRPHEAITALETFDPERGWARGWSPQWSVLAELYEMAGRHEEALSAVRRAPPGLWRRHLVEARSLLALGQLDDPGQYLTAVPPLPLSKLLRLHDFIARALHAAGRDEDAEATWRRALDAYRREHGYADAAPGLLVDLAYIHYFLGDFDAVLAIAPRAAPPAGPMHLFDRHPPEPREQSLAANVVELVGAAAARLGDTSEVERAIARLEKEATLHDPGSWRRNGMLVRKAIILAASGMIEEAIATLEPLEPYGVDWMLLAHHPDLRPLHQDPRFRAFLAPRG